MLAVAAVAVVVVVVVVVVVAAGGGVVVVVLVGLSGRGSGSGSSRSSSSFSSSRPTCLNRGPLNYLKVLLSWKKQPNLTTRLLIKLKINFAGTFGQSTLKISFLSSRQL